MRSDRAGALASSSPGQEGSGRLAAVGLSWRGGGPDRRASIPESGRGGRGGLQRVMAMRAFLPTHPGRWVNPRPDWIKFGITAG